MQTKTVRSLSDSKVCAPGTSTMNEPIDPAKMIATKVIATPRSAFASHLCCSRPSPQRPPGLKVSPPYAQSINATPTNAPKRPHTSSTGRGIPRNSASSHCTALSIVSQVARWRDALSEG